MSTILNKNTDGVRTRALNERELMQELTIGSNDYGKIKVGTNSTYDGEITLAKDSELSALSSSQYVASGFISKQDDSNIFEEVVGNEYKMANADRFVNFDGKVIDTYGPELVVNGDFSDGTTGWTFGSGITVVDGLSVFTSTPSTGGALQNIGVAGASYLIEFDLVSISSGGIAATAGGTNSTAYTSSGRYSTILKCGTTNDYVGVRASVAGTTAVIDNISVREITTVDMTNDIPEVTVLDQATNGLVVQSSVNAGSYVVVDKEELVTNGTFDSDTSGWGTNDFGSLSVVSSTLELTNGAASFGDAYQILSTEIGLEYILSIDMKAGTNDARVFIKENTISGDTLDSHVESLASFTRTTIVFTATTANTAVMLSSGSSAISATSYYDNISVQLKSDVYRAERDTADMYDYENDGISQVIAGESIGKVVFNNDGNDSDGLSGHYYKRIVSGVNLDLTEVNYGNTTAWLDLGTASNMSLLNPYFQDRTQFGITNKILATMRDDGTIKTEVCFVDTAIEDCGNAYVVMTDNGYSKLSNGLYSKGSDVVTPLGTWSTLNKGAFHPFFNYFGTANKYNLGHKDWYEWTNHNSIADTFLGNVDDFTLSGTRGAIASESIRNCHPQGKFYDIIYPDQWIDLRIEANAVSEQDELNRIGTKAKSGQLDGIGGVVTPVTAYVSYTYDDTPQLGVQLKDIDTLSHSMLDDYIPIGFEFYVLHNGNFNLFKKTYTITGNYCRVSRWDGTSWTGDIPYADKDLYFSNGDVVIFKSFLPNEESNVYRYRGVLPHPSSGTALRTDWIGDPANYPQAVKDRLASGLPMIGMNPLLVGQDGADYTSGTSVIAILNNKAISGLDSQQYTSSTDSFASHSFSAFDESDFGVSNEVNANIDGKINLLNYTAKIPTTQVTDPKAVKLVGNYATTTNSHSIYKGNQLVPTGKVNVGNGSNGLESKVVENVNLSDIVVLYPNTKTYIETNMIVDVRAFPDRVADFVRRVGGTLYEASIGSTATFGYGSSWGEVTGNFSTPPTHSTIALDNSNSPAVKFIETIAEDEDGMAHYQVFAQELAYNDATTSYDGDDSQFTQLTNGTLTDDNGNTVKTIVASTPLNKYTGAN